MDSVELEQSEEHNAETYGDHLLSLDFPCTSDFYGEPPVFPHVGDQYQVEIPPLTTELESLQLRINTGDILGIDNYTRMGLEIPIMWVHHVGDHVVHEQEEYPGTEVGADEAGSLDSRNNEESWIDAKCSITSGYPPEKLNHYGKLPQGIACKAEFPDDLSDHGNELAGSTSQECTTFDDQMNMGLPYLQQMNAEGYRPLPGSLDTPWSDAETHSFLLGLYIFGKNLVQVRKFIECKEMGDILSYYYGKFYRSDAHRKWSECRKIRSRRSIHGQRIFTGWRQQEVLSRVLPAMSKDVQDTLQEATKTFNEGRSSLEEYVFTLKAAVGIQVLVEAVGIGKGKHDLTGIVLDPVRTNQGSIRPEIPIGKACSNLTSGDIINFLTGDFRLSKARSNDLFWEAVWPRLLARGWHSEQPKDIAFVGSKHALVFLIPGINKFSRRKLVKGNHYFDSVSDVLNKVTADPRLLELEVEGAKGCSDIKDEYGWDMDTRSDQNGISDHQRHCYLRPRVPNCNSELMKFTVVDTSLVQGDTPFKVRELRSLPVNATSSYVPTTPSGETGSGSSEEQQNSADTQLNGQGEPGPGMYDDKKLEDSKGCMSGKGMQSGLTDSMVTVTVSERRIPINGHVPNDKCLDLVNDKKLVKDIKRQVSRRIKSSQPDCLAPVTKRRRLTSCNYGGTRRRTSSFPRGHQLKKEETYCELESYQATDIVGAEFGPSQGRVSTNSSAKSSVDQSSGCVLTGNCYGTSTVVETTVSQEKPQPRAMIDLNLPVPPDFDTGEPFCMEAAGSCHDMKQVEPACLSESKQQLVESQQAMGTSNGVLSDQQPSTSGRRQSTRNRPPTAKALEALACGLLGTKRKGRGTKSDLSRNLTNRPSRRARKTVEAPILAPNTGPAAFISDIRDSNVGMDEWYGSNGNHDSMFSKPHVQSERKGIPELLGVP